MAEILLGYIVAGLFVLELVRPDKRIPPGGIARVVLLWPIVVLGTAIAAILDRVR